VYIISYISRVIAETPIPAAKIYVLGFLTHKHYFSSSRPPKGTTLVENTSYEISCVVIGVAVWPGRGAKNTQTKKQTIIIIIIIIQF